MKRQQTKKRNLKPLRKFAESNNWKMRRTKIP